jgi:hypothetical protein
MIPETGRNVKLVVYCLYALSAILFLCASLLLHDSAAVAVISISALVAVLGWKLSSMGSPRH